MAQKRKVMVKNCFGKQPTGKPNKMGYY